MRPVDVMMIGTKAYLCHISLGAYSWIASNTSAHAKKRFGRLAYIWNSFKFLLRQKLWTFHITTDGHTAPHKASTLMVTNVGVLGARNLRWSDRCAVDDGIIEIFVIKAKTIRHYLHLFWTFLQRKPHPQLKKILYVTKEAKITGPHKLPIMGDGEEVGKGELHFTVKPRALQVLCMKEL